MTYAAWEKKHDVLIQAHLFLIEYTFNLLSMLKSTMEIFDANPSGVQHMHFFGEIIFLCYESQILS